MATPAQQIFRELDTGVWKPFYLVVGEEPFQMGEMLRRLKAFFVKGDSADAFNYDSWDGEGVDAAGLLASLETLPGLFDGPDSKRLVVCHRFDKVAASGLEILDGYFKNPLASTCFLLFAAKADKRKTWVKEAEARGHVIEVNEPYDRDWPKWQGFLERKLGRRVESSAWEVLIESAGRSLSLVWAELEKLAVYIGDRPVITRKDVLELAPSNAASDIFDWVDDVLCRRKEQATRRYYRLLRSGESDIKILSLLVRQFRLVDQYLRLAKEGVTEPRAIAPQIGVHPFLVTKIRAQAQHHSPPEITEQLARLAECDYRLKTGEGRVFENFLLPYFS